MQPPPYQRIILSPHLDDGSLSCGGAIHHWTSMGEPVLVLTLMTADPPSRLSSFAEYQHASWQLSPQEAYAARRAEDAFALERLGADYCHLDLPDCIYRGEAGRFFYTSDQELFGSIHPADLPLIEQMAERLAESAPWASGTAVYAPLAIGNHIDHQLLRKAAERWRGAQLWYYEDYPYADRTNFSGMPSMTAHSIYLTEADMQAKIEATGRYRSQIAMLFGSQEQMAAMVRTYGRRVAGEIGWAERFWQPDTPDC